MTIFEITIGSITLAPSYYGLMYVLGFVLGYIILEKRKILSKKQLDSLFLYVFLGVILGGRLGYVIFYDLSYYLSHIGDILKIWEGGMSFHGGALGVMLGVFVFVKINKISFIKTINEISLVAPIGIFFGRIGNYINKELLGFNYTGVLAVEKNGEYYFPSPLVEAFLEGIILFIILYFVSKTKYYSHLVGVMFIIWYAIFRLLVELFIRQPDTHIGYIFGNISMGALLSIFMIIIGVLLLFILKNKKI